MRKHLFSSMSIALCKARGMERWKNHNKQGLQGIYNLGKETETFIMNSREEVNQEGCLLRKEIARLKVANWCYLYTLLLPWLLSENLTQSSRGGTGQTQGSHNQRFPNSSNGDVAWPKFLGYQQNALIFLL